MAEIGGTLGELAVKIKADSAPLKSGLKGAEQATKNFAQKYSKQMRMAGMAMVALGGTILATAALSVKSYAKMGDEIQKMALRTGFSTETLSELRYAAEISGTSLEGLEKAVKRMAGTILDASYGLETYVRAFREIGIEVEELEGLNPEEQFLKIALAVAEIEEPMKRSALAEDIFGKAGTKLLPMLAQGAEGIEKLREEAHKFAPIFDQEAANAAAKLTDRMGQLTGSMDKVKMVIAEALVPVLIPLIEDVRDAVVAFSKWADENERLAGFLTLAATGGGALLIPLGMMLVFLPSLVGGFKILAMTTKTIAAAIWAARLAFIEVTLVIIAAATAGLYLGHSIRNLRRIFEGKEPISFAEDLKMMGGMIREASDEVLKAIGLFGNMEKTMEDLGDEANQLKEDMKGLGATIFSEAQRSSAGWTQAAEDIITAWNKLKEAAKGTARAVAAVGGGMTFAQAKARGLYAGKIGEKEWYAWEDPPPGYYTPEGILKSYQHGGIVRKPTLALIGEAGPEAVVPLDKFGNITINFTQPVFFDREDSMNQFVSKIRTALKRQDRLEQGYVQ